MQFRHYENLVPLNRERHKSSCLKPGKPDLRRLANQNTAPLTVTEFADAAHDFPIVFAGTELQTAMPLALLGLTAGNNRFVDQDGGWTANYRPAYLRMYPLILAPRDDGKFNVCIDEAYPGLNDTDGKRLFLEDGSESDELQQALKFLQDYQTHRQRTIFFCDQLRKWDLLDDYQRQVKRPNGQPIMLKGIYAIDETRLRNLTPDALAALNRNGMLAAIYAHLFSLKNLDRLAVASFAGGVPDQ